MAAQSTNAPPSGTMIAYRLVPGKTEPQRTVVLAAGVCHSDVHVLEASATQPIIPGSFILGHEGAGIVVSHGEGLNPAHARRLAVGMYVAICLTNACDRPECDACSRGLANVCFESLMIGLGMDGCWAEYVKARASTVVPVPGNNPQDPRLTPGIVAAATDAVMSPYHALKTAGEVKPGQTVVIIGCGGLGINAIQIAKNILRAGTVVAVDLRADNLALAREVGADHAVTPDALLAMVTGRNLRVDVVLDLVGVQSTVDAATGIVRVGGIVVLLGLGAPTVAISPLPSTMKQLTIKASFGGNCEDLQECLDAIAQGKIRPQVETRPMDECSHVIHGLAEGKIRARVALIPQFPKQ